MARRLIPFKDLKGKHTHAHAVDVEAALRLSVTPKMTSGGEEGLQVRGINAVHLWRRTSGLYSSTPRVCLV